ncbi:MAG: hypothetical protein CO034_00690 [Parcubacteria group bacterium CG_4_9_14_0_2_um_filter_35_11]|nr:MAG: hypothetical protein CO034_00690 [Parcubacteria group bacterium CG_4_9_14_0_2_um_filter_35_11]
MRKRDKNRIAVEIYNKIAKKYTERFFNDFSDRKFIDNFLSLLPERAKILDAGCGPGNFTKYFLIKGYSVEGVDLSKEMIKIAKQKVPQGSFKIMDLRKLKYPSKSFDGLFAAYSLIHIPKRDIISTLKGFNRVLRRKGVLFLAVQKGRGEKFVKEPLKKGEEIFIKFFTKKELEENLRKTSFKIIKTANRNIKVKGGLGLKKLFIIAEKI